MKRLLHEPDNQNLAMSDFLALEPVINDSKRRKFPVVSVWAGQWPAQYCGIYWSTGLPGSGGSFGEGWGGGKEGSMEYM